MAQELGHVLTPHEEVRDRILDQIAALPVENVALRDAHGRVLAEDLVATEAVPPFDNSAMDGYAVYADDLVGASDAAPVTLSVVGHLPAGVTGDAPLERGCAIRIMTGAPLPVNATAVIPHELTQFTSSAVTFFGPARNGQNIRRAGGDMKPGDVPLRVGMILRGPQVGVAATLGRGQIAVTRRPRVAILSPGKELVEPWAKPGPGQIRNSNAYALASLIEEAGAEPDIRGIVEDDPDLLRECVRASIRDGADVILSTGGVSAGDHDYVQTIVREDANPGWVFKTDMRPGKPQVFGLFDGVPLLGMPGNPAAAIVSFTVFARPVIRKMTGRQPVVPESFPVRFESDLQYKKGRVFMLRARVEPDLESAAGGFRFAAAGDQDSSFLASLAVSNALIRLPADRDVARAGDVFPAQWIHSP
jgi:molybdopterin molybdotransferase